MTTSSGADGRDLTLYCAAACDLNHAGIPHSPWDCNAPTPAPVLTVQQRRSLADGDLPWVRHAAASTSPSEQEASPRGTASKLVRDLVPAIMGQRWRGHVADDVEHMAACAAKVAEEHGKWRESGELEDLAGLVEAAAALAAACARVAGRHAFLSTLCQHFWTRNRWRVVVRRAADLSALVAAVRGEAAELVEQLRATTPQPPPGDETLPDKLSVLLTLAWDVQRACIDAAQVAGQTGTALQQIRQAKTELRSTFHKGLVWHGESPTTPAPDHQPPNPPTGTTQNVSKTASTRPTGRRRCP